MPRFSRFPFVNHLGYVGLETLEWWATLGTIAPLSIAALVAYIYLICGSGLNSQSQSRLGEAALENWFS